MAEVTQRELAKIRTDIHNLRDRFSLMLSRAGGHINGQVDLEGWLQLDERAAPSQPAADHGRLYAKSDGLIYWQDDGGSEHDLTAGGGAGGAPEGADYLVLTLNATLTGERRFVPGTGLDAVDGGANGDYTVSVDATELSHDDLLDVSADDHHNRQHDITSAAEHIASGYKWDVVGLTANDTIGFLTPSADQGGGGEALLKSSPTGGLELYTMTAGSIYTSYLRSAAAADLTIIPGGDLILHPTTTNLIRPGADNSHALGTSTMRFTDFYAVDVYADYLKTVSGDLELAPTGDAILDPVGNNVLPGADNDIILGSAALRFVDIYAYDLYADTRVLTPLITTASGNLELAPAGDVVLDPTGNDVLPGTGYDINLGSLPKKYLTLHAAELWVETLVAQDTMATIGGRVLIGPTTTLTSDLGTGDTTIYVKHNQMASGDRVVLEADGKLEFMAITSAPGGGGPYSYTVTRNLDGTGANQWYAGDAVFNTGTIGDGFIDLYSVHALNVAGNAGPTIVGNVRNSTTFNDWTEHWAIGNLDGLYGYGTDIYGVGLGEYGDDWLTIESTNGIRMYSNNVKRVDIQPAGTLVLGNTTEGEYVNVSSSGIEMYHGGAKHVNLDNDGSLWIGSGDAAERLAWDATNGLRIFDANNDPMITLAIDGTAEIESRILVNMADDAIFADDGLLLLGPGCELTATSWASLRGQTATIANALQTMRGAFPGVQGIVMEAGTTNYALNPSFVLWNGAPTSWTAYGAPNPADETDITRYDGHALRFEANDAGNQEGYWQDIAGLTPAATYKISVWCYGISGVCRFAVCDGGGYANPVISAVATNGIWERITATKVCPAGGSIRIVLANWTIGDHEIIFDGVQLERGSEPTSTCIGSMPWCSWSDGDHASSSVRVGTAMTVPTAGNISASKGSIKIWFRPSSAFKTGYGCLWSAGNANTEFDSWIDSSGKVRFYTNTTLKCITAAGISVDEDHCAVFEWDVSEDKTWLYVDGVLAEQDDCGVAPTLHTSMGIGYSSILANAAHNLNGIVTEFVTYNDLLSADEVAADWNLRRPTVDHGAVDSPGIYIVDGKFRISSAYTGTRIEITPDEIVGYNGSTKQFYLQAEDGKAYAGGGVVRLNSDGIEVEASTAYANSRSYKFKNTSGTVIGRYGAIQNTGDGSIELLMEGFPISDYHTGAYLRAEAISGKVSQAGIEAKHGASYTAGMSCDVDGSNVPFIWWQLNGVQRAKLETAAISLVLRGTATLGADVRRQANDEITYDTSIRAVKTNIRPHQADRDTFMHLKPHSYKAIEDPSGPDIVGFVAEEVAALYPEAAIYTRDPIDLIPGKVEYGDPRLINYNEKQLLAEAISVIQQQEADLETLRDRVAVLETA